MVCYDLQLIFAKFTISVHCTIWLGTAFANLSCWNSAINWEKFNAKYIICLMYDNFRVMLGFFPISKMIGMKSC